MRVSPDVNFDQFWAMGIWMFLILCFELFKKIFFKKKPQQRQRKVKSQMGVKYSSLVCCRIGGRTVQ